MMEHSHWTLCSYDADGGMLTLLKDITTYLTGCHGVFLLASNEGMFHCHGDKLLVPVLGRRFLVMAAFFTIDEQGDYATSVAIVFTIVFHWNAGRWYNKFPMKHILCNILTGISNTFFYEWKFTLVSLPLKVWLTVNQHWSFFLNVLLTNISALAQVMAWWQQMKSCWRKLWWTTISMISLWFMTTFKFEYCHTHHNILELISYG